MSPGFLDSLGGWLLGRLGLEEGTDPREGLAPPRGPSLPLGWGPEQPDAVLERLPGPEGSDLELLLGRREPGARGERLLLCRARWGSDDGHPTLSEPGSEWSLSVSGLSEARARGAWVEPLPGGAPPSPELADLVLDAFRQLRLRPEAPLPEALSAPLRTREAFYRDAYRAAGLRRQVELIGDLTLVHLGRLPWGDGELTGVALGFQLRDRLEDAGGQLLAGGAEQPREVRELWWIDEASGPRVHWIESPCLAPDFPPPVPGREVVAGVTHQEDEGFERQVLDAGSTRLSALMKPAQRREVMEKRPADVAELMEPSAGLAPPFLAGDFSALDQLPSPLSRVALLERTRALHLDFHRARAVEGWGDLEQSASPFLLERLESDRSPVLDATRPEHFDRAWIRSADLRGAELRAAEDQLRLTLRLEAVVGTRIGERREEWEVTETLTLAASPTRLAEQGARALLLHWIHRGRRGPVSFQDLWRAATVAPPASPGVALRVDRDLDRVTSGPGPGSWEQLCQAGQELAAAVLERAALASPGDLAQLTTPGLARLLQTEADWRRERGLEVRLSGLELGDPIPLAVDPHPERPALTLWIPARARRELRSEDGELVGGSTLTERWAALAWTLVLDPESGSWRVAEVLSA